MTNTIDTFQHIESAAHDGDFGHNQRPTPSDNQANASNYKVGRTQIYGLNIAIEQPRHSYRTGIDKKTGERWVTKLAAHYGYFSRTRGADGDPIDCFIGFYPQSEFIYVINQYVNGSFDETKVMIAFPDENTARKAYLDSYAKGWKGLHSIIPASISQFKWWLKNGNHKKPLAPEHLPYDGLENMNQNIKWDSTASPKGMTIDKLLYEIRRADGGDHLLLDSVCMADILEDVDSIMTFDALVTPYAKLERKMNILKTVMERAGNTVKPLAVQISDPFKQNGTAQVAVVFELSDGQSVSIFFHNPDVNPKKIAPADELISFSWRLNKKDITIVVAPEHGDDLNIHNVAMRIMKLAEKNSPAFQKANVNRAAKMQVIEDIKTEIVSLETELKDAQHELEVAKVEADDRLANIHSPDNEVVAFELGKKAFLSGIQKVPMYDLDLQKMQAGRSIEDKRNNIETKAWLKGWIEASTNPPAQIDPIEPVIAPAQIEIDDDPYNKPIGTWQNLPVGIGITTKENGFVITERGVVNESYGVFQSMKDAHKFALTLPVAIVDPEPVIIPPSQIATEEPVIEPEVIDPVAVEKHYSEQILDELVANYGWDSGAGGFISKNIGGSADGGALNPNGDRIVGGSFDDSGRYLSLQVGMDNIFDIDCRDLGIEGAAKEFNDKVNEWADRTAFKQPQEPNEQENQQAEVTAETEEAGAEEPAVDPTQAHIDTLQAVIDGAHDSMGLDELLDIIDAAATALIDAGLSEIHDSLIGAAAERWAKLEEADTTVKFDSVNPDMVLDKADPMTVYCWTKGEQQFGTENKHKAEKMAQGRKISECDISDFKGTLLGKEYLDSVIAHLDAIELILDGVAPVYIKLDD